MAGETLALTDVDIYFAKQSAKGTAATGPFLTAMRFTEFTITVNKEGVDGVPGLGLGLTHGPATGLAYDVKWTGKFRLTAKTLPTFLFDWFCTRATTNSATLYTHTWSGINRNYLLPRGSMIVVFGEGATRGTGLASRGIRDNKLTGLEITISSTNAIEGTMSGVGLNWGPTAGTETFSADTSEPTPVPVNAGFNTFTMPTAWSLSGALCLNSIDLKWVPDFVIAPGCLGSGEKADILLSGYRWDIDIKARYDSIAIEAENYVNTGAISLSGATAFGALSAGYQTGTFVFNTGTIEHIGGSSPLNVPYQFGGSFPAQWKRATTTSNTTPIVLELSASTFDTNWNLVVKNDLAASAMAW